MCPRTGSAQSFPCRAAQTGRDYLVKTLLCVFKATSRVLQGDHGEMGSKEMFACPASCQQLLPKHRELRELCFPSHLSLPNLPSTGDESASGKTWLAGKRLSLSWLVPDTLMGCQGSLSAQVCMARRLPAPSHPTAIPGTQKELSASLDTSTWAGPIPSAGKYPCPGCPGAVLNSPFYSQAVE